MTPNQPAPPEGDKLLGRVLDGRYRIDLKPVDDRREWIRIVAHHPGYRAYRSTLVALTPDLISEFRVALSPAVVETAPRPLWRRVLKEP